MWAMEHAGCLAQLGDPNKNVDRVGQLQIAGMLGITRETVTKRIAKYSAPDPNWPDPRREAHSRRMRAIAADHPHWNRARRRQEARRAIAHQRRIRRNVACILQHNAGFGQANSYALAMPDQARPAIAPGQDPTLHAGILAAHFGENVFDRGAQVNGYRKSYGWIWHPKLPDARPCACRVGQRKFNFQKVCPKCEGKGFVIGGSMPDYGRILLHWYLDRGIDQEMRDGDKITKHRGILEGWTQEAIGRELGMNVSTIRRYERTFKLLNLVRTVAGKVTRHCSRCDVNYSGQCGKCGSQAGPVVHRDPHKILWLPSRTLDRDLVKAERDRLEATLALRARWLDRQQLETLKSAVELSLKVLAEWEGHEHRLESFWSEMRRRLAATPWLLNVLYPARE
jgi:hypothetical protein